MNTNPVSHERKSLHFDALHGLRGVAALMVVLTHFNNYTGNKLDLGLSASLAVDLFFLLSGLVIAHAYDAKFRQGMTFAQFCEARLLRLYPLYALSIAIALVGVLAIVLDKGIGSYSRSHLFASLIFSGFFLPTPPALSVDASTLFPLNGPTWSLLWELVANAAFAAVALRIKARELLIIVAVSFGFLLYFALSASPLDGGAHWDNAILGPVRVGFSFFLGVYFCRHWMAPANAGNFVMLVLALVCGVLMWIKPSYPGEFYNLFVIVLAWPVIVLIAARVSLSGLSQKIALFSGNISYAVYVIHIPMINLSSEVVTYFTGDAWNNHGLPFVLGTSLTVIAAATVAHYVFDTRIRVFLRKRLALIKSMESVTQF